MSVLGVLADGFAAAGDAGGLVAFGLVTSTVIAGAQRRTALAEVCAIWGLGFIAAYVVFAALGGELEAGFGGLLALTAAAAVGFAVHQRIRAPWVEGAAVALWALCALRANAAADGDTLLRIVVWCSSAAVLATLALRLEEALAPGRAEDAPVAAPAAARAAAPGPAASAPPRPEPVLATPATHLWSSDGYREATSRAPS